MIAAASLSTGTGNFCLTGAAFYKAFGPGGSDMFFYLIRHAETDEWEAGTGHMQDPVTLVRDTVVASSSGGRVDFSAGAKKVCNEMILARVC